MRSIVTYIIVTLLLLTYIGVPNLYSQSPDFNYREPYFLEVNTPQFSKEYKTHRLDDQWGIWGHNLLKIVNKNTPSDQAYALIDNKRNKHQFCFSSTEVEEIILDEIAKSDKNKFVIAPQDNLLACGCNLCLKKGNTKNNASPAVFSLLKKLALKKKKLKFYTLAYLSVSKPPEFSLPQNVGVFYSTIKYQNGIPYKKQPINNKLISQLNLWKQKTNHIIIWDYALNFDNYHDFYPNITSIQQNLSLFKNLNIKGVFFNGSESYALLQGLKTTLISKLLNDISIDVHAEISVYLKENYPKAIADILIPYYLSIEEQFFNSKFRQGIYSNIVLAERKYLQPDVFLNFYEQLKKASNNLTTPSIKTQQLLVSLTYLKLELIKVHGINALPKTSKNNIIDLLNFLREGATKNNIIYINERKNTFSNYIKEWYQLLFKPSTKNLLSNNSLKILSNLDEDYNKKETLTDGKFGFSNYDTNWLLVSKDDLIIEIAIQAIKKESKLILNFLNDPKHHIYFPYKITLSTLGKVIATKIIDLELNNKITPITFNINPTTFTNPIKINVFRKKTNSKNVIACDEIILKN